MAQPATFDIDIAVPRGRTMRVAVALPNRDDDSAPGVVVIHEGFGLNDDIRAIAARFAGEGYAAVAPDLFSAGPRLVCLARTMVDMTRFDRGADTAALLDAARDELARYPVTDATRTAVIGFCMGGGFALAYGVRSNVRASAVNYGFVPRDTERLRHSCPIVGSYGAEDRGLRNAPPRLAGALRRFGVAHDVKTYPGAGHSFLNDGAPGWLQPFMMRVGGGYRPEQAADAWRRIFAFFDEHVRGNTAVTGDG
jgi:carboxymethylenebutenolidase